MISKAAEQLAWTLRHTPGFVAVAVENCNTIVLVTRGALVGPATWFGFPVRVTRD